MQTSTACGKHHLYSA